MQEVADPKRFFHIPVRISRGDPPKCGSEFLIPEPGFLHPIQKAVIGHADGCSGADQQMFRRKGNPCVFQRCNFPVQMFQINHHAWCKNVRCLLPQDPGREQVHYKFPFIIDNSMPRIIPALVAHHDVIITAQKVDHPAFSFITPVDTDD